MLGKKLPEEWRKNIGIASSKRKGNLSSNWMGGIPNCLECGIKLNRRKNKLQRCKKCVWLYLKGRNSHNFGKKATEETKAKMSKIRKGKKRTIEQRLNFIKVCRRGENHSSWRGGIVPLTKIIRRSFEYKLWREAIFKRDDFTCNKCFMRGGLLHPHHKIPFALIFKDFINKYNQFSPIEDKETLAKIAINHSEFWDINNGETLCIDCHRKIHGLLFIKRRKK